MQHSYQKFIILTTPRTGSNYLSHLLHSHPNIISFGEVFYPPFITASPGDIPICKKKSLYYFRKFFPVQFLNRCIYRNYSSSVKAVGFRIFYHYQKAADHFLHFPPIENYLIKHTEIKVIHLIRKNLLENYVSYRKAINRDFWWTKGEYPYAHEKIKLNYKNCLKHFSLITKKTNYYRQILKSHNVLEVYYENILKQKDAELKQIQKYLGVKPRKLSCEIRKLNTLPLDQIISNYQTLKKNFNDSPWENFFY